MPKEIKPKKGGEKSNSTSHLRTYSDNHRSEILEKKIDAIQSTLDWMIKGMSRAQSIRTPFKEDSKKEQSKEFEVNFSKEDKPHLYVEAPPSYIYPYKSDSR